MIDLSLIITIGVIFFLSLTAAYMRSRVRDRCLKSWEGFHVTLERTTGKLVWGVLHVAPTGMELSYTDSVQDERHIESSYLLYASEYGDIQALYRYVEQLSDWGKKRRVRDIEQSFHPGVGRRFRRSSQNFLGTATDSLNEVFGLVLGRVQKTGGRYLSADGTSTIKSLSGKVLGQVGTIYDPLLERYIGNRVVVEILEGDEVHEHVGIFKNYSQDFIEVLDVRYPQRQMVAVTAGGRFEGQGLILIREPDCVRLTNQNEWPVLVHSYTSGDSEQLINAVVDGGETIGLHVDVQSEGEARINLRIAHELDILVPRTRCVVRHLAEHYRPEQLTDKIVDLVFDVGKHFAGSGTDGRDNREALLRQELRADPKNGAAAANLGLLLIQKDELAEAEKWLRRALEVEYSLPDGGRRARMQLREIERRRDGLDAYVPGTVQAAAVITANEGWDV
jgi:hypothetical protein